MKNRDICFLLLTIFIIMPTTQLFSQPFDRPLLPLSDEDFTCFQTVDCVLSNEELKAKGWNFAIDESVKDHPNELVFNMKGMNVLLNATYTKEGNLIRAKYQLFNRPVPPVIMNVLAEGDYKDWTVVANTLTVLNFDHAKSEYVVELMKGELSDKLHFILLN